MRNLRAFFLISFAVFILFSAEAAGDDEDRHTEGGLLSGIIKEMPEDGYEGLWTVDDHLVVVSGKTEITDKYGRIAAGRYVRIRGEGSGSLFFARKVEMEESKIHPSNVYLNGYKFYGTVEVLPDSEKDLYGIWQIAGRKVRVDSATEIDMKYGRAEIGAYAEAECSYIDDMLTSYKIRIIDRRGGYKYD